MVPYHTQKPNPNTSLVLPLISKQTGRVVEQFGNISLESTASDQYTGYIPLCLHQKNGKYNCDNTRFAAVTQEISRQLKMAY